MRTVPIWETSTIFVTDDGKTMVREVDRHGGTRTYEMPPSPWPPPAERAERIRVLIGRALRVPWTQIDRRLPLSRYRPGVQIDFARILVELESEEGVDLPDSVLAAATGGRDRRVWADHVTVEMLARIVDGAAR